MLICIDETGNKWISRMSEAGWSPFIQSLVIGSEPKFIEYVYVGF